MSGDETKPPSDEGPLSEDAAFQAAWRLFRELHRPVQKSPPRAERPETAPLSELSADAESHGPELPRGKAPFKRDEGPVDTADLAGGLKDLIFKACVKCHFTFAGNLEVCPVDGAPLREHSMLGRDDLLSGFRPGTKQTLELTKYCPKCRTSFPLHQTTCEKCATPLVIPTAGPIGGGEPACEAAGGVIADKYRILKDIGAGGFGSVYLAKHESLGKRFAIKMLRAQFSDQASFRDRFHGEALKLSRLEDENIVKVIDFGEWEDSQYMVTEYVEGRDLGSLIYEEKMSPLRVARIMKQVAGALAEAHSKKIVHLDLKPANILVSQKRGRDVVKVIDFGIAEIYSTSQEKRQVNVGGTPPYMAPEQWRREPLAPRADIYSFGIILYECLAGRPPFRSDSVKEYERAHCQQPPPPLRKLRAEVPMELEKLTHRCIEKQPSKRVESAEALESMLDSFISRTENVWLRWVKVGALTAAILAVVGAAVLGILEIAKDKEPPRWVTWEAAECREPSEGGPGTRLSPLEASEDSRFKRYVTREPEVELVLEAADNGAVEKIVVEGGAGSAAVKEERKGNEGRFLVELTGEATTREAFAVDSSGNESPRVQLTFERPPDHVVRVPLDALKDTNEESVELTINAEDLEEAKVVLCSWHLRDASGTEAEDKKSLLELEVQKDPDKRFRLSGRDADKLSRPEPGKPLVVSIPIEEGLNRVEVRATDIWSGEPIPRASSSKIVRRLSAPLEPKFAVKGGASKRASPAAWVTAKGQVDIEITLEGAQDRLEVDKSVLRWSRNKDEVRQVLWNKSEITEGKKAIQVILTEGENKITVEPLEDRYGNESEARTITVHKDSAPPRLKLARERIDFHGKDPPVVSFEVTDTHLPSGEEAFSLLDLDSGERLAREAFQIQRGQEDGWELRFSNPSSLSDGKHSFRIKAQDALGNPTSDAVGGFVVYVDQNPPRIETVSPASGQSIRRGESLSLVVKVEDASRIDRVEAEPVLGSSPSKQKAVVLKSDPKDPSRWRGVLRIDKDGLDKPGHFDSLEPGFHLLVSAKCGAGHEATVKLGPIGFAWENGDELRRGKDGSVLVYHEACPARKAGAFWLARTEVTNRQYDRFLKEQGGKHPRSSDWDASRGRFKPGRLDFPVRGVSPQEMRAYAWWAGLDLPRRSEWLVAAFWDYVSSDERPYPWPGPWPQDLVSPVWATTDEKNPKTEPTSLARTAKEPPPRTTLWKLEHMWGNVWEVVVDDTGKTPLRLGGGYELPLILYRQAGQGSRAPGGQSKNRKQLCGEDPSGQISWTESDDNLGFRCILRQAGGRP